MVSISLSIPEKTKKLMNQFPEIDWAVFIEKSIHEKVEELLWGQKMLKKLKQQESFNQWSVENIKKSRWKRIEELKQKGLS